MIDQKTWDEIKKERRNAWVKLKKDEKAIYIGSGETINNVLHICNLVKSNYYILSDLNFKKNEIFNNNELTIELTKEDGFECIDKKTKFVMIDQAVPHIKGLKKIDKGSYVLFSGNAPNKKISERIGLKFIKGEKGKGDKVLFKKVKDYDKKDLEVYESLITLKSDLKILKKVDKATVVEIIALNFMDLSEIDFNNEKITQIKAKKILQDDINKLEKVLEKNKLNKKEKDFLTKN